MNTDSLTLQSGHLARQDGAVNSDAQANLFLTRWLVTAQKQRRFPREIAPDIEWLLKKGRTLGVNAKLGIISGAPAPGSWLDWRSWSVTRM